MVGRIFANFFSVRTIKSTTRTLRSGKTEDQQHTTLWFGETKLSRRPCFLLELFSSLCRRLLRLKPEKSISSSRRSLKRTPTRTKRVRLSLNFNLKSKTSTLKRSTNERGI